MNRQSKWLLILDVQRTQVKDGFDPLMQIKKQHQEKINAEIPQKAKSEEKIENKIGRAHVWTPVTL